MKHWLMLLYSVNHYICQQDIFQSSRVTQRTRTYSTLTCMQYSIVQHKKCCLQMSKSSSSERKDHLIGEPSFSLPALFFLLLSCAEQKVRCVCVCVCARACARACVCVRVGMHRPVVKDKNIRGVMTVLLYTCCKNGPGSVYRDGGLRVKRQREKVTEQLCQLFPLLWAFYNIPLSLNELPGDTALNSAHLFCCLLFSQFIQSTHWRL